MRQHAAVSALDFRLQVERQPAAERCLEPVERPQKRVSDAAASDFVLVHSEPEGASAAAQYWELVELQRMLVSGVGARNIVLAYSWAEIVANMDLRRPGPASPCLVPAVGLSVVHPCYRPAREVSSRAVDPRGFCFAHSSLAQLEPPLRRRAVAVAPGAVVGPHCSCDSAFAAFWLQLNRPVAISFVHSNLESQPGAVAAFLSVSHQAVVPHLD